MVGANVWPRGRIETAKPPGGLPGGSTRGTDVTATSPFCNSIIHNPAEVRRDLDQIFSEHQRRNVNHVREIALVTAEREFRSMCVDNTDEAMDWIERTSQRCNAIGAYVSSNPIKAARYQSRPSADDAAARWSLFFDIDVEVAKAEERPSSAEEQSRARAAAMTIQDALRAVGHSDSPERFGSSGNGYYLLYPLPDLPNDKPTYRLIRNVVGVMATRVAAKHSGIKVDTGVIDAARIRRISGTYNRRHGGERVCRLGGIGGAS